jgi:uncharacterized protein
MLVALWPLAASAQQLQLPSPVGYVNDFANVITAERAAAIERVIEEVRQKSGGEIVVVTLPSLQGRTRDEVGLQIGREWRVGQSGQPGDAARNTGLIVLVVPRETSDDGRGHLKIETGLGTSTFITATEAGRIADLHMVPAFREGDYGLGIHQGVEALALEYADRFGFELTGEIADRVRDRRGPEPRPPSLLMVLIVIAIAIALFSGRGKGGGGPRGPGGRGGRGRRRQHNDMPIIVPLLLGQILGGGGGGRRGGGMGGLGGGGFGGGGFGGFGGGGGSGGGGIGRSW